MRVVLAAKGIARRSNRYPRLRPYLFVVIKPIVADPPMRQDKYRQKWGQVQGAWEPAPAHNPFGGNSVNQKVSMASSYLLRWSRGFLGLCRYRISGGGSFDRCSSRRRPYLSVGFSVRQNGRARVIH